MRITRNQLRQIIKEALEDLSEAPFTVDDLKLAADTDVNRPGDRDGDGVPDNQEGTMDPDREVSLRLGKVRDLLADADEIARQAPDHQDKGEGFAMAELQMVVDDLHQMYGTEYWTQG